MEKVLITGIAGAQGRLLARRLLGRYEVCGVDRVAWEGAPAEVQVHALDLRRSRLEDVVRAEQPAAVVHLGLVSHFRVSERTRHDVNVRGTRSLLDHCVSHGVKALLMLSSGYTYGAFAENPYYIDEDHPLSASRSYPEIRDLVEVDVVATAFLWRYPHIRTCVLRPVGVLGPTVQSLIAEYLRMRRVPVVMGFDPIMQFLHENDLCDAIALALAHRLQGVFNIAGAGAVPLRTAIRASGGRPLPLPEPLVRPLFDRLFRLGLFPYPAGAIDYLKFPVTLDGSRFAEATDFRPLFGLGEILASLRE